MDELVILGIVLLFDIIRNIYGNIEESIIGILVLIVVFGVSYLCFYLGDILRSYRKLILTEKGFQYIFKNKLKEEFSWSEISKIQIRRGLIGSMYNINILGTKKRYIEDSFPGSDLNINKLKYMLKKIHKYRPKYKFIIETERLQ